MSHTLYESPWSEACYSEPRFSRWSSRAIRRKIKTALPRYGRILMIYLKRTEMSHAFCVRIYYDLFEVTWGQTFAKTVKLRSNRTGQSRYIHDIYVAIQNFVKNLIRNYLRSNQVMKLGSNRAEIHSIYTCFGSELYEKFKFNIICDPIRSYVSTQNLAENSN